MSVLGICNLQGRIVNIFFLRRGQCDRLGFSKGHQRTIEMVSGPF